MNPAQVPADEFSAIVAAQLATLPGWVRRAVQDVAILTEDEPPPGAGPEHGLLLGRYHGVPLTRRGPPGLRLPARHHRAVPRADTADLPPGRRPALRVRRVLLHEIGHALGLSEERLRELGVG